MGNQEINARSLILMMRKKQLFLHCNLSKKEFCFIISGNYEFRGNMFNVDKLLGSLGEIVSCQKVKTDSCNFITELTKLEFIHLAITILLLKKTGDYNGLRLEYARKIIGHLRTECTYNGFNAMRLNKY